MTDDVLATVRRYWGYDTLRPLQEEAIDAAVEVGASVCGIVGRDGGETARRADACVVIPTVEPSRITPHTEGLAAVVWHLLVSHPALQTQPTKWESIRGS